ncbi:MAG TPA: CheB methylesterase domain-containing protein [bacterium]
MPLQTVQNVVVIGSSAGGPRILKEMFSGLPKLKAGMVLVQHMPKFINQSLKESIERVTGMVVAIARDGDALENGKVLIAPSEQHVAFVQNRGVRLFNGQKVNFVCPSVDVAMLSLLRFSGMQCIGVILSGMGRDGADGMAHIKHIRGVTIAQNEETCAVFGMPKEAIATGCVDYVLSPGAIREKLIDLVGIAHR